jgi:serine/threonine-protein kinase
MVDGGSGRYRVVAARPLTSEIERHAGLVLNRYLGPIATVICRRAAGQASDEAHYFDLLAGHLRSGTERARFLDDVQRHRH